MLCPSCNYTLQKFSVTTNEGGRFDVDHCGRCGGTWFDPYEINRIPFHEIVRLSGETVLPKKITKSKPTYLCPRCFQKLKRFTGETMPRGVRLLRCNNCHGIWATQKDLEEYKTHQIKTIDEYKTTGRAFPSLSMIFVPIATFLFLLLSTFVTFISTQEAKENRIRASYLIENLSFSEILPGTVTISFQTKNPLTADISYGTSIFELQHESISQRPSAVHSVILTNLKPQSTYIYTITLTDLERRSYTTPEKTFSTR